MGTGEWGGPISAPLMFPSLLLGEGLVPNLDVTYILPESRFNSSSWTLIDGGVYRVRQACDCPVGLQIDLTHSEDTN